MKERVHIQYSVKLDELDVEVRRLLNKAHVTVESVAEASCWDPSTLMSLTTLRDIATAREMLAETDYILSDVTNIINGFIEYQTRETFNVQQEQIERQVTPTPPANEGLNELQERLALFRQNLEDTGEITAEG